MSPNRERFTRAPRNCPQASIPGVVRRRGKPIREYWRPQQARQAGPTFNEAVEETERLLLRAVELRLFADVPVGALLSGGVDSSLICWAIRKLGGDVTAFTVGTPGYPGD